MANARIHPFSLFAYLLASSFLTVGPACALPSPENDESLLQEILVFVRPIDLSPQSNAIQTDRGDGTIELLAPLGNWLVAKCSQDNTPSGNLYGGGGAADACNSGTKGTIAFCVADDNSCNGGVNTGNLHDPGSTNTSPAFASCDGLILGGRDNWRVPTHAELKYFLAASWLPNPQLYPDTTALTPVNYWSSTSGNATNGSTVNFSTLGSPTSGSAKTSGLALRCIADL